MCVGYIPNLIIVVGLCVSGQLMDLFCFSFQQCPFLAIVRIEANLDVCSRGVLDSIRWKVFFVPPPNIQQRANGKRKQSRQIKQESQLPSTHTVRTSNSYVYCEWKDLSALSSLSLSFVHPSDIVINLFRRGLAYMYDTFMKNVLIWDLSISHRNVYFVRYVDVWQYPMRHAQRSR